MAIPTAITDLSATLSSNAPAGGDQAFPYLDDYIRAAYGFIRQGDTKASDVASGASTDLGAVVGRIVDIDGTTAITSFGTVAAGIWRICRFKGALTLTHHATSLILPTAANITTAAGDCLIAVSLGSGNWVVPFFMPAAGYARIASPTFTGVVSVAGGSVGAPGLAVSGDADTGIASTAGDILALVTGGVARVRANDTGTVGIGSDASTTPVLYVNGAGYAAIATDGDAVANSAHRLAVRGSGATNATLGLVVTNSAATESFAVLDDGYLRSATTYSKTSAGAANVGIDSNGYLYRSTSSGRFKTAVETLDPAIADKVLSLRPVWYRSAAPHDDPSKSWYGLIAEEVAEVDPRLVQWGQPTKRVQVAPAIKRDGKTIPARFENVPDDSKDPVADGVMYDRLTVHLLSIVQRQNERIAALEKTNNKQGGRDG